MELVCIVCPNSCRLTVTKRDGEVEVSGAKCKRGVNFAKEELTCPMRTVTSSVRTTVKGYPVVSVKTDGEVEKSKIPQLMKILADVKVQKPLPLGSVVVEKLFGTDVNVVTTTDMEEKNE